MADRVNLDQATVLERFAEHLRRTLDLDERTCFLVDFPEAVKIPPGGPWFVTVAPGDGQFWQEDQHQEQLVEQSTVQVTAYTRIKLDSTGHTDKLLVDRSRGLMTLKKRLLRALVGTDLSAAAAPVDGDEPVFLRQLVYAMHATAPKYDEASDKQIGWITITFGVDFDWDLTDD